MTPNQVDALEFWEVEEILEYWLAAPPTNELVASFVGYKAPVRLTAKQIRSYAPPGCLSIDQLRETITKRATSDDPSGIGGLIARFPNGHVPAQR